MGGTITVRSEVNKGADFIFYIKSAKARYVEPKQQHKPSRSRLRAPKFATRVADSLHSPDSSRSSFSANGSPDPHGVQPSIPLDFQQAGFRINEERASVDAASVEKAENLDHLRQRLRVLIAEDNLLST